MFAPGFQLIDRRSYAHLDLDRDQHLESLRFRFAMRSSRWTAEVLATRGHRLVLARTRFDLADGDVGPSESEALIVHESDEHVAVAEVAFDSDDLDAAYAELDTRYFAGEAAPLTAVTTRRRALVAALAARDWGAWAATLAPDFVVYDHSPLGWGTLDRAAYVESVKQLAALAPDFRLRTDHLWFSEHGMLGVHVVLGTHEGGAFERPRVTVSAIDAQGREHRRDIYTLEQFAEARARLEKLCPSAASPPDPLRIPPNAATRAWERRLEAYQAGNWQALDALWAPTLVYDDRRRGIRVAGGRDLLIASERYIFSHGAQVAHRVLATAGDYLALQHHSWRAADDSAPFEIETLVLMEVDPEGRLVAAIVFDPDDRRAAGAEMLERYARSDAARCIPAALFDGIAAYNAHDLDRFRAALPEDFILNDHRRTGVGRLESADDHLASVTALFDLAPDLTFEPLYVVAADKHGLLAVAHAFGTLADGGEFEQVYVWFARFETGRVASLDRYARWLRMELFEPEDLDRARARFEELRKKMDC